MRVDGDQLINRRILLKAIAGGAVSIAALPLLAACGGDDDDDESGGATPDPETEADPEADPEVEGESTATTAAGSGEAGSLTIYSGRSEELVGPIIAQFEEATGINVEVKYGGTAELAATLLEEGDNTPADVFFAQDAGALGAVGQEGMFIELPDNILELVEERFRDDDDQWIGVSGRARVLVYNTDEYSESDMPASILDFTSEEWQDKLGWAPTNASFQAFVTALRILEGDDVAREWLEGVKDLGTTEYPGNVPIVQAAIDGEIGIGFVNHYYLYRFEEEAGGEVGAQNFWYTDGDPGALINVAGIGILAASDNVDNAEALLEFFLSEEGQTYFSEETFEYPLVEGIAADPRLVPLDEIQTPDIDLSDLDDLEGTLVLLTEVGLI